MTIKSGITEQIRNDIFSGALSFGSRLSIQKLADRYQTSHMPVREAIKKLTGEGLLISEPNKGASVRSIDEKFVSELMELRSSVEAILASRAADRATSDHISRLEGIEEQFEDHIKHENFEAALGSNREFHDLINSIANNSYSSEMIYGHWLLLGALWQQFGYGIERFPGVVSDHRSLIAALRNGDGRAAELIMGSHVMKSKIHLLHQMKISRDTDNGLSESDGLGGSV